MAKWADLPALSQQLSSRWALHQAQTSLALHVRQFDVYHGGCSRPLAVASLPGLTPSAQLPVLPMTRQSGPRYALQAAAPLLASTPLLLVAPLARQAALSRQCTSGVCHMLVVKALLGATIKVNDCPMALLMRAFLEMLCALRLHGVIMAGQDTRPSATARSYHLLWHSACCI